MPRRSDHQIIVITTANGAIAPALILYSAFSDLVGITIIETLPHQVAIIRGVTLLYFCREAAQVVGTIYHHCESNRRIKIDGQACCANHQKAANHLESPVAP